MASLLPLLHDLLPIFLPSEVQIARAGALVAVEERAERPPPHLQQQQQAVARPAATTGACEAGSSPATYPGDFAEPIQLLDREGRSRASDLDPGAQGPTAGPSDAAGGDVSSQSRGGPRVIRKNAMVGATNKMCVTDVIIHATTAGVLLTSRPLEPVKALRADISSLKGEAPPEQQQPWQRFDLAPGDFAFVPAWTEHQVVNNAAAAVDGGGDDVSWVLFRHGAEPVQVDLDGWGGRRI